MYVARYTALEQRRTRSADAGFSRRQSFLVPLEIIRTCFFIVDMKSRSLGSPDTTSRMSELRDGSSARPKEQRQTRVAQ